MNGTRELLHIGRVPERNDVIGLEDRSVRRIARQHLTHAHLASPPREQEAEWQAIGEAEQVGRKHSSGKVLGELLAHEPEIRRICHRTSHVLSEALEAHQCGIGWSAPCSGRCRGP